MDVDEKTLIYECIKAIKCSIDDLSDNISMLLSCFDLDEDMEECDEY